MTRSTEDPVDVSVDVYVRPSQVAESLDEHVVALRDLAAEGVVDEVDVHCWPGRVPTRSPTTDAVDCFAAFREWARAADVSIQPPFSVQTVDSEFTGERRTYLSTPVCCLAVTVGDALAGVYPHTAGDEHRTVADGIAALAAGDLVDRDALDDRLVGDGGTCTECDGKLVNVQGVRACHDCALVDRDRSAGRPPLVSR